MSGEEAVILSRSEGGLQSVLNYHSCTTNDTRCSLGLCERGQNQINSLVVTCTVSWIHQVVAKRFQILDWVADALMSASVAVIAVVWIGFVWQPATMPIFLVGMTTSTS